MTKKQIKDLMIAGEEYVGDWLCWNEKKLLSLPDNNAKRQFIFREANLESCAGDMAMVDLNGNPQRGLKADCAADYIYEGMIKRVKKYLGEEKKQ